MHHYPILGEQTLHDLEGFGVLQINDSSTICEQFHTPLKRIAIFHHGLHVNYTRSNYLVFQKANLGVCLSKISYATVLLRTLMNPYQNAPIPRIGIPINIAISAVIGILVGFVGEDFELGISTGVLIGMTLGFVFQEALLVQILSREANIQFQHRILEGKVTLKNRLLLLLTPILLILLIGILLAAWNGVLNDSKTMVRVLCVSLIIMFGIDPLFGLVDKGVLAIFGAAVVYIIILQAGFNGYDEMVEFISPKIGDNFAFSVASSVVMYLLLSARWTYYRLFCFNQVEDFAKAFIDTGLPLVLVIIPYFPKFLELLEAMFLGI